MNYLKKFFTKNKEIKIGLAFGGGGMRGFSHVGVIRAFEEYGLKFDYVTGTSVGSIIGAAYANGMTYKQIYDIAKNIKVSDIKTNKIIFVPSKTDGIEKLMIDNFGDVNIEDLKTPFSAVAVDLKTTNQVCICKGNLAKAVAGSCCVPGIFQPVEFEDFLLCDGGLQNSIPANIARMAGCDYVISVDCNKSRTYGTESSKVLDVLSCSIRILMKSNAVKGYLYSDLMIAPNTKKFKSTKTEGFEEMIEEGYKTAIDIMPEIKKIFEGKVARKKIKDLLPNEITFFK